MNKSGQFKSHIYAIFTLLLIGTVIVISLLISKIYKIKQNTKHYTNPNIYKIDDEISIVDKNGVPLFFKVNYNKEEEWICPYNIPSLKRTLKNINSNINSENGEHNLFLTLDIEQIKKISLALSKIKEETHVVIADRFTGDITTLYDNQKVDKQFFDTDYSLNDLGTSDIKNAFLSYLFYKADKKLITNFICDGDSLCDKPHGAVDIDNLSKCKSAINHYISLYTSSHFDIVSLMNENKIYNLKLDGLFTGYLAIINEADFQEIHLVNGVSYDDGKYDKEEYKLISINNTSAEEKDYFLKQINITSDYQKIFTSSRYIVYLETDSKLIDSVVKTLESILE